MKSLKKRRIIKGETKMAKYPNKDVDNKEDCSECVCRTCREKCFDCCDMCNERKFANASYECEKS
jgi:hypothetical protein